MRALLVVAFLALVGAASAATNTDGPAGACRSMNVAQVLNQNAAGEVNACRIAPDHVATSSSSFQVSASLTTPQLTGTTPSLAISLQGLNGCTAGTPTTTGTAANAASGAQASSTWTLTMSAYECRGYVRATATSGSVTVTDLLVAFNTQSDDTPRNTVTSGSLAVTNTGSLSLTGDLDVLDRACQASPHSASCNPIPAASFNVTSAGFNVTVETGCSSQRLQADPYACTLRLENQPANATEAGRFVLDAASGRGDWLTTTVVVVVWLAYAIGSRFIRHAPVRLLGDFVVYGVLFFPVNPLVFALILAAQSGLVILDVIKLATQ